MLAVEEVARRADLILGEVERAVVGKRDALELVLLGFLADGHVLIEDFPGLAKTLTARSFAQVLDIEFKRIQFTPDLMPSDVTGSSVYNQRTGDFDFRRGPIFTNLLLGDEINRAPPKTQAALLEAMQERQVTTEGETLRLDPPFLVIATQNPIEYEGTYPLPEAQLDRFLLRVNFGYPSRDDEWTLLERRLERASDELQLDAVIDGRGLVEMQEAIEQVHVTEPMGRYVVDVVAGTRSSRRVQVGASPRGSLALLKLSRCRAVLAGRDFVTPEDVKAVAAPALAHRLMLRPELWVQRIRPEDVVQEVPGKRADASGRGLARALSRSATPKIGAYAGLTALGLLAGLAVGLPELVVLAAPFAVALLFGLLLERDPDLAANVTLERDRVLEGEEIPATIELVSGTGAERVELLLEHGSGLVISPEFPRTLRLHDEENTVLHLRVKCLRWGAYDFGRLQLRTHDVFGLFRHELVLDCRQSLKVYPREQSIRQLLRPRETQVYSGNHVARQRGEGIEFADLRPFVAGDRVRHVNWRASARRGELWVNEHHPERNADVVIFLDSFAEARRDGRSTLDPALRAASSLVRRYLREKDRVGFVSFGGMLNWLLPSTGTRQLYRIVDAMLDTQILLSYAWRDINVIPRGTLPPHALVVALTPLLDDRAAGALLDLRARGFDLVLIEVSPSSYLPEPEDELELLAVRLWRLRREALRDRFARAGVPVAVWEDDSSLAAALEEVSAYHRFGRLASA